LGELIVNCCARLANLAVWALIISLTSPVLASASGTTPSLPIFSHVFVIVMENHEYNEIIGSSAAPYINGLAKQYSLATQYYAVTHPSLPNYLSLTAASTFGITSDCENCFLNQTNLADQIEAGGRTWRAYMESMPSPCYQADAGNYAMWHNPWLYYNDIRTNATRCNADVVPYTQFSSDLASSTVPNFMWVTPNLCDDMHDCSVSTGDTWLLQNVPQILNSSAFKNGGVLFITWDEGNTSLGCCTNAAGGKVATLVISPTAVAGLASTIAEDHYSLVRTVEDSWGMPELNGASCTCTPAMSEYFLQDPPPVIPEVPLTVLLALVAVVVFGAATQIRQQSSAPKAREVV
jgi:phosphatidylinositol-3-phosphatase